MAENRTIIEDEALEYEYKCYVDGLRQDANYYWRNEEDEEARKIEEKIEQFTLWVKNSYGWDL